MRDGSDCAFRLRAWLQVFPDAPVLQRIRRISALSRGIAEGKI
jgi:hypothetical protein